MSVTADARAHMDKALDALRRELASVRTGKATPALLDTVRVDAYGSHMSIGQVATVSTPEPRLLVVQPWDKGLMAAIEKGIRESQLGLNPANDGNVIRVPIPQLTEERRKDMVRLVHKLAEEGRVAIRQARHHANDQVKKKQNAGEMSEDDARRTLAEIQKATDEYISKVDQILKTKEKDVMEV